MEAKELFVEVDRRGNAIQYEKATITDVIAWCKERKLEVR